MDSALTTTFLWGVLPYLCLALFFVVPVIRMVYRPFGFSTRASGLFNRDVLGAASLTLHWGIVAVFVGHVAGFVGGLLGWEGWITFFYWAGLVGGFTALFGSVLALARRVVVREVRAMSQWDDYLVHIFLIAIMGLALYQVVVQRIFGVAYAASSWLATVIRLAPQPELMDSAGLITKTHVFLALTFFAVFPFTKLVHLWTYPVNYFVRPYQAMRTHRYVNQARWEFSLRSDKSFLTYSLVALVVFFGAASSLLGGMVPDGVGREKEEQPVPGDPGRLAGSPLYISQCARCHGVAGKGDGPGANSPTFATLPRDLTQGRFAFISTDNGRASDEDLGRTIRRGLVAAGMPSFSGLDDKQVASLVAVTRGFAKEGEEAPGATIGVPPRPAEADAAKGRGLYLEACASCHGKEGRGDGPSVSPVQAGGVEPPKDFAGRRAQPRDLTMVHAYKVGTEPEQLYLRIAAGTPPVMPAFQEAYEPEQIWSIVLYVRQELMPPTIAAR